MLRRGTQGTWAPTTAALAVALALTTDVSAGKSGPIKGTGSGDTIEVVHIDRNSDFTYDIDVDINGKRETYTLYSWEFVIKAGAGNDEVKITATGDNPGFVIYGEAGDDTLHGGSGDDVLIGGTGGDEMRGFDGHDWMKGCEHKDHMYGGAGNDLMYGKGAEDTLRGGPGDDLIDGGDGEDKIWGEDGKDQLFGDAGADQIRGGHGDDVIRGGAGNDMLRGDDGEDVLMGENGSDTLEDNPSVSETKYEENREDQREAIEDDFGVEVRDYTREWSRAELHYLRTALEMLDEDGKVINMWQGTGKCIFRRKKMNTDTEQNNFTVTGETSTGMYLYDLNHLTRTDLRPANWAHIILHEMGHAYKNSPSLSSSQWSEWKELSGWSGSTHDDDAEFVSQRADDNASEDWAESFAYYFTEPSKMDLGELRRKYDFLNDIFGKYDDGATPATATAVTTPESPEATTPTQVAPVPGGPPKPPGTKPPVRPRPGRRPRVPPG